ncbi:MAG: nuclear transport factor 2 family protein [Burkholderiaceae bacterium]|nr:nuclear transport factor 2 family protein [Burkholderiaceae bacterium]
MNTKDIAQEFVALCKQGRFDEAGRRFWSEDVVSLEPMEGAMREARGRAAVAQKGEWWSANHDVHGVSTEGPWVHGDQFGVRFTMDVTPKVGPMAGQRIQADEIGLYTVRGGKIVEERFFYGAGE